MIVKLVSLSVVTIAITLISQRASANTNDFEKACLAAKKKASLCACWSRHLKARHESGELNAEQLQMAIQVVQGQKPEEGGNTTSYDNLADLLAGLEPNCQKKPANKATSP